MTDKNITKKRELKTINDFMFSELFYSQSSDGFYQHNYNKDLHLIIVDKKNKQFLSKIYKKVSYLFKIINSIDIVWSDNKYIENSARLFNGELLLKEFTLIIFEDKNPKYQLSMSSKQYKNVNIVSLKDEFHHLTNTYFSDGLSEFFRLAVLVFGKNKLFEVIEGKEENTLHADIVGTAGWADFKEFIEVANMTASWLILRNFEYLPYDFFEKDKDVDMLCADINLFASTMNLKKWSWGIGAYETVIEDKVVPFDVRFLGDNYYDKLWQYNMLESRILTEDNVPRMNDINYFFSLIYHSKIQKTNVKPVYVDRLFDLSRKINFNEYEKDLIHQDKEISAVINNFLALNHYRYVRPLDISVPENTLIVKHLDAHPLKGITLNIPLNVSVKKYVPEFIFKLIPTRVKTILKRSFPRVFK